ncbi:MAG TPA: carboxypeptidase regulatory-like domain-containing protein [Bryobacteraceae bacterium]|nr:carboxypeptidase regulatory-like domain-containing protein [Bryobacteraceae bacterium]
MSLGSHCARALLWFVLVCGVLRAQVEIYGHVVDETGAPIAGAHVELLPANGGLPLIASSDLAGNFTVTLPAVASYGIRAERQGFFVFTSRPSLLTAESQLTVTLNHQQEFPESINVTYSPPAIDLQDPSAHKELDNTEIQAVPYPAPQDYRNALPLIDGVVQDNSGRPHFNGGSTDQTNFTLNGFNISDPVTGNLEARVNIDSVRDMDLESSRFSAENGRGSAGVLEVQTKMGDDRLRFGGTNFIPSLSTDGGLHFNKWTPRLELSGPIVKSRAWFYDGFDAFYDVDTVHGLPPGPNRARSLSTSNLTSFQVNLTPSNILTGSFLYNLADANRSGLSIVTPPEATIDHRQNMYMSTIRDQAYFGNGALLDVGFADTRTLLNDVPQGNQLYQITPFGSRGNYFVNTDRHAYRKQWIANVFLPAVEWHGSHQLKFGIDFERESFHGQVMRHDYEVLRADNSVARFVQFMGAPFAARKNFEAAQYVQDHWTLRKGLAVEAGLRAEWNEVMRDLELAPRLAVVWAPERLPETKFSAGYGVYYDAISLDTITRQQGQVSLATFYLPDGTATGPLLTSFQVNEQSLEVPYYRTASVEVERKLPFDFYGKTGYTRREGSRGFTFVPDTPVSALALSGSQTYTLSNGRHERYDAIDVSVRRTFAGQFEWFAGYTRSSARSNAAVDYSLENPIFAQQMPGPVPWDTPNRFHTWGWAPIPKRLLPRRLEFLTRNTSVAYLVEYRTGFPFNIVDQTGFLVGQANAARLPGYFNINLHLERKFRFLHYLWAWRFGFDNLTNNGNPNTVNNVLGTPEFLTYGRGQVRAFSVRLRLLGRK